MRIRITRPAHGQNDGVDLRTFQVGCAYDVSPALGMYLVTARVADLLPTLEPVMLVPLDAEPRAGTSQRSRSVADDAGRRPTSILSFEPFEPE